MRDRFRFETGKPKVPLVEFVSEFETGMQSNNIDEALDSLEKAFQFDDRFCEENALDFVSVRTLVKAVSEDSSHTCREGVLRIIKSCKPVELMAEIGSRETLDTRNITMLLTLLRSDSEGIVLLKELAISMIRKTHLEQADFLIFKCLNELSPTLVFEAFSSLSDTEILDLLCASPYHKAKEDSGDLVPIAGGTSLYLPLIASLQERATADNTEDLLFTRELREIIKIKKAEGDHPFVNPQRTSGLTESLAVTQGILNNKIGPESPSASRASTPFEEYDAPSRDPSPENVESGLPTSPSEGAACFK